MEQHGKQWKTIENVGTLRKTARKPKNNLGNHMKTKEYQGKLRKAKDNRRKTDRKHYKTMQNLREPQ